MQKIALLSVLATIISTALSAHAGNQAGLQVIGKIHPASCVISLGAGGVADYGVISPGVLKRDETTVLGSRNIPFSITCTREKRIALLVFDNRGGSEISPPNPAIPIGWVYGLGKVAGRSVGSYTMAIRDNAIAIDNQRAKMLTFDNNGPWRGDQGLPANLGFVFPKGWLISWTADDNTQPAAIRTVSGVITVEAYLNKRANLPLTQEIPLDGSVTLEVIHL